MQWNSWRGESTYLWIFFLPQNAWQFGCFFHVISCLLLFLSLRCHTVFTFLRAQTVFGRKSLATLITWNRQSSQMVRLDVMSYPLGNVLLANALQTADVFLMALPSTCFQSCLLKNISPNRWSFLARWPQRHWSSWALTGLLSLHFRSQLPLRTSGEGIWKWKRQTN